MPLHVSQRMRRSSAGADGRSRKSGAAPGRLCISSTSSEACQKKRYGLMVVPKTATTTAAATGFGVKRGQKVRSATCPHGT